jgi:hypothetical protein
MEPNCPGSPSLCTTNTENFSLGFRYFGKLRTSIDFRATYRVYVSVSHFSSTEFGSRGPGALFRRRYCLNTAFTLSVVSDTFEEVEESPGFLGTVRKGGG